MKLMRTLINIPVSLLLHICVQLKSELPSGRALSCPHQQNLGSISLRCDYLLLKVKYSGTSIGKYNGNLYFYREKVCKTDAVVDEIIDNVSQVIVQHKSHCE